MQVSETLVYMVGPLIALVLACLTFSAPFVYWGIRDHLEHKAGWERVEQDSARSQLVANLSREDWAWLKAHGADWL